MSGDFGVTPQGFNRKPMSRILSDMQDGLLSLFGNDFNLDPATPEGLFLGLLAGELDSVWAALQAVYSSFDPLQAGDASLDNVSRITGTVRIDAQPSTSLLLLVGAHGVTIPAGSQVSAVDVTPKVFFKTLSTVVLVACKDYYVLFPNEGQSYPVVAGTVLTYGGNVFIALTSGYNGSIPPVSVDSDSVDGDIIWRFVGAGDASVSTMSQATVNGPIVLPAYCLTVIQTPVEGWSGAINPAIPNDGVEAEVDGDLRLRRELELRSAGLGTAPAVAKFVGDIRNVPDVDSVQVFENGTDYTVGAMPPHSMEVMVHRGLDVDVANAIWESKPLGTAMVGSTEVVIEDDGGNEQTIKFTRPVEVPIYVRIDVVIDPMFFPIDGDTQIADAVTAAGKARFGIGENVVPTALYGAVAGVNGVPGVIHVSAFTVSTYAGLPQAGPLVISDRWLPVFDQSRFTINHVEG